MTVMTWYIFLGMFLLSLAHYNRTACRLICWINIDYLVLVCISPFKLSYYPAVSLARQSDQSKPSKWQKDPSKGASASVMYNRPKKGGLKLLDFLSVFRNTQTDYIYCFSSAAASFETCRLSCRYRVPNNDMPTFNGHMIVDLLSLYSIC